MKLFKYLAVTLIAVGVLATTAWFVRNELIERLSAPILKDYDLEMVDISLDALATGNARIGRLELLHANGTTIVIEGLSLPISSGGDRPKVYSADRVSIITATREDDNAPFELALLVDQFLALTNAVPNTGIRIAEFNVAPYPVIHDLSWTLSTIEQSISGAMEGFLFSLVTTAVDETNYDVDLTLSNQDGPGRIPLIGKLHRSNLDVVITGSGILDLTGAETILKFAGIAHDEIAFISGAGDLLYELRIPYDIAQSSGISASLMPTSPWRIDYARSPADSTQLLVTSQQPVEITADFPSPEWSAQLAQVSLQVTDGQWKDVPVSLTDLKCNSAPSCSMNTGMTWKAAKLPLGSAQNIEFSAAIDVTFGESGVRVGIDPDASLLLTRLSTPATGIDLLSAHLVSGASLEIVDTGWTFDAVSVDASIESMSAGDAAMLTFPVYLENVHASGLDQRPSLTAGIYTPGVRSSVKQQTIALPGLRGTISMTGADFLSSLDTVGLQHDGRLNVRQNTESGSGSLQLENAAVSFATTKISRRVSPWNFDGDLVAGVTTLNGQADWTAKGDEFALSALGSVTVADAAGFYADIAFTGLTTALDVGYATASGFTTKSSSISVALVDMGLPIENISADYKLDLNSLAADVQDLHMSAFGGSIRADPFSFRTDSDSNNLVLHAESIQLAEVLSLQEFEAISVTGSISVTLPVTIEADKVTITGGTVLGDAPGGVIRYRVANATEPSGASSLDLVTQALSNFVYKTLTSDVDYSADGDLVLKMKLEGRNPDMEGNRPVILNLSVENNVPQMLRSLQAARAVEEVLEKRAKK